MRDSIISSSMTKHLITISWDASMTQAHRVMQDHKIRHLPVTDATGKIFGILSDRDVNRAMNPDRPGFAANCRVQEYISWPIIAVDCKSSIKVAAKKMIEEKISAVVVVREQVVIGILTTEDILQYLVTSMGDETKRDAFDFFYTPLVSELMHEAQAVGI
jgi:predicted transcriptional regulator